MNNTLKRDVELLFELGTLRNIRRSWNQLANAKFQNICEHSYRLAWISYLIGKKVKRKVDISKILIYSLSADIYKSRTGDHHYVSYTNVKSDIKKALNVMFKDTSLESTIPKTITTYKKRSNYESLVTYGSNGLENRIELRELESEGVDIAKIWGVLNDQVFLKQVKVDLVKDYWNEVRASSPNSWHLNANNRFNFKYSAGIENDQIRHDLQFLFELGTLRNTNRLWTQFVGERFANLTEHTFRVIWLSLILASKEKDINYEKLILMAMLHDISEIRSTDTNYINSEYNSVDNQKAIKATLENLSESKELLEIWNEFNKKESMESKIVKDADRIDPVIELVEQEYLGMELATQWKYKNIGRLYGHLYSDYANKLLLEIPQANPNDWHLNSQNRFDNPDW